MRARPSFTPVVLLPLIMLCTTCVDDQRSPTAANTAEASLSSPLTQGPGAIPRFPEIPDFVPGARIASPDNPLPPDLSDDELTAAVIHADGRVIIGLKAPGHRRTVESGEIPGLDRSNALAARASLRAAGVEIIQTYRHSSAVAALVDPERVGVLRRLPVVNYIEPGR